MSDIVDRIDELVDAQLQQERSGYDRLKAPIYLVKLSVAEGAHNTARPLTRSLDLGKEGLAMDASRTPEPEEAWRPIPGLEGQYEVSDLGRVRSLDRIIRSAGDANRGPYEKRWKGRILNAQKGNPYLSVRLPAPYKRTCRIHELVAAAFIGPRAPGVRIRHVNGNLQDNRADNLVYADVEHRFWSRVKKTAGCWNWTGSVHDDGYAMFDTRGKKQPIHRVSYQLHLGDIPAGMEVDHICRNRRCVRPDHLRAVTPKQNSEHRGLGRNNKSGALGVHWVEKRKRWRAQVGHNGKIHYVGEFRELADAAEAARLKRVELFTHNDWDRIEAP